MANLKQWIEKSAGGEDIVGVVIGEMGWGEYNSELVPDYKNQPKGKILTWEQAEPLLNYNFDAGFGAPGCNAVYVWTTSKVLFISQYDGATAIHSIPRNPVDVMPEMPGG